MVLGNIRNICAHQLLHCHTDMRNESNHYCHLSSYALMKQQGNILFSAQKAFLVLLLLLLLQS